MFAKNRGGWPARPKTVFDAKAHRIARKAGDILDNAKTHLRETVDGDLWDAVVRQGDWATTEAMEMLDEAMRRVNQTNAAAQKEAK